MEYLEKLAYWVILAGMFILQPVRNGGEWFYFFTVIVSLVLLTYPEVR